VRMQAQIERVKNSAGARNAEERFEMSGMIPHHGGDAIAAPQAELRQRRCKLACPASKIAVSGPNDGAVRFAGKRFQPSRKVCRCAQIYVVASTENPSSFPRMRSSLGCPLPAQSCPHPSIKKATAPHRPAPLFSLPALLENSLQKWSISDRIATDR